MLYHYKHIYRWGKKKRKIFYCSDNNAMQEIDSFKKELNVKNKSN